jgi:hypothetical protein
MVLIRNIHQEKKLFLRQLSNLLMFNDESFMFLIVNTIQKYRSRRFNSNDKFYRSFLKKKNNYILLVEKIFFKYEK